VIKAIRDCLLRVRVMRQFELEFAYAIFNISAPARTKFLSRRNEHTASRTILIQVLPEILGNILKYSRACSDD
jgi:hypothetical protein